MTDVSDEDVNMAAVDEDAHIKMENELTNQRGCNTWLKRIRIDRHSFGVICDYLTLTELATKVHRINKEWTTLLLGYQPSQDHPARRDMRVPTSEDDDLEVMSPSLEATAFRQRQFWMVEDNLMGLSRAAPIYRRLVTRLILDSSEHISYRCSSFPPAVVSPRLMRVISNAFPNISFLYCRLPGFTTNQYLEDGSIDTDNTWSLPRQLHTLDCVIEVSDQDRSTSTELQLVFDRIGSCSSLRRCSILLVGPNDRSTRYQLGHIQALTQLPHLFQLSLVPSIIDYNLCQTLLTLLPSWKDLTSLRVWSTFPDNPEVLQQFFNTPVHQLKQLSSIGDLLNRIPESLPYLARMTALTQLCGKIFAPTPPECVPLFTSLSHLTDLTLYLDDLDEMIRTALAQCIHLRKCELYSDHAGEFEPGANTIEYYQALGVAFGRMKELHTLNLYIGSMIPEKLVCVSPRFAPTLCQTLTSLEMSNNVPDRLDRNVLLDLSPLTDFSHLTSLEISHRINCKGLTAVLNTLLSLKRIVVKAHGWAGDKVTQFVSAVADSNICGQLEELGPASLLADIDPIKAANLTKFVALKELTIHYLQTHPGFLRKLKGLNSLQLGGSGKLIFGKSIIDIFIPVLGQLSQLTELGICDLPGLTSQHMNTLLNRLPSLVTLMLKTLPGVTELSGLSERRASLRALQLEHLPELAPETMIHLSQLSLLRSLVIKGCPKLPLESYQFIIILRYLKHIDFDLYHRQQILKVFKTTINQSSSTTTTTMAASSSFSALISPCSSSPLLSMLPEFCLLATSFPTSTLRHELDSSPANLRYEQLRDECARRHPFWCKSG